ncbi:hypothetical protein RE428_24970 [Marinobacter nanhaiticus D15-8W]|uniref:DUF892 family protein n=1 Tax=Marinobacter nanhaiticus D15-8W TaxID=626887 RepID=N6WSU5_9GAMM|nr:DUF892 family protein [Marinobacter nanhaiticus]ENO14097.1 DUF892 family protein [Marinobacter nanhaiticus D15-8W]BES71479.1 hypothetical protein RE428_24970 [Marinobacter nanhaiticus D15-8W]
MATDVLNADSVIKELSNIVELDYDAIAAYRAAIDRIDDTGYTAKLEEFVKDHERHVRELSEVIRREGGTPPDSGDAKKMLTKGQVVIADIAGDKAILNAMKMNEQQTVSKYESATKEAFPEHVQTLLDKGLEDERRHKAWIERTLEAA